MQNDMRDRLVELLDEIHNCCPKKSSCEKCEYRELENCRSYSDADFLIANGVVLPPCKTEENDGLYGKYTVVKNSTGKLVTDCFVLKPSSDETARKALLFYADNCNIPQLSADIKEWLQELKELSENGNL